MNLKDYISIMRIKWEAYRMKPETREIYVKNAVICKEVQRPEVKKFFGVRPITKYYMSINRTRYYEFKKMGLNVLKHKFALGNRYVVNYFVEVTPSAQNGIEETYFLLKGGPMRFLYYKVGSVAKLYFCKEDIGKTRYSK